MLTARRRFVQSVQAHVSHANGYGGSAQQTRYVLVPGMTTVHQAQVALFRVQGFPLARRLACWLARLQIVFAACRASPAPAAHCSLAKATTNPTMRSSACSRAPNCLTPFSLPWLPGRRDFLGSAAHRALGLLELHPGLPRGGRRRLPRRSGSARCSDTPSRRGYR